MDLIAVVLEPDTSPVTELLPALLADLHQLLDDTALALAGVLHDNVWVLSARGVQDVRLLPTWRQPQLVEVNQPAVGVVLTLILQLKEILWKYFLFDLCLRPGHRQHPPVDVNWGEIRNPDLSHWRRARVGELILRRFNKIILISTYLELPPQSQNLYLRICVFWKFVLFKPSNL